MKKAYILEKNIIIISIMFAILITFAATLTFRKFLRDMEYKNIYNRVKGVYNNLELLDEKVKQGKYTKTEAEEIALRLLKSYEFSENSTYVWVGDFDRNIIFHPNFKSGTNIKDFGEKFDKNVYENMTQDAINTDETVATMFKHKWKKHLFKDANNEELTHNKLSLALKFEPWHWVIGSGNYTDETDKIFKQFILFVFLTYLSFFIFVIFIMSYFKNKSIIKMVSSIGFASWYKNTKGEFVFVNKALLNISSYNTEEELYGLHHCRKDASEELLNIIREEEDFVVKKRKVFYTEREFNIDGKITTVQIYKVPIFGLLGNVIGIVGVQRDITKEKDLEKLQEEFISLISHELRTPLTSIIGSIRLILSAYKKDLTEQVKSLLEITDKNSAKLKNLVDNILDVSRLNSGKIIYTMEVIDIVSTIKNTIKELESYAKQYEVSIVFNPELKNVFIYADNAKFKQILTNLISNATKFSKKNSNIEIKVSSANKEVITDIINYDAFIPEGKINTLFDKFIQAAPTDMRSTGGSGLGLYITKKFVEEMDGEINVTSNEKSTKFSVKFNKLPPPLNISLQFNAK